MLKTESSGLGGSVDVEGQREEVKEFGLSSRVDGGAI